MKRNVLKNVQLDKREKIYRDFRKLNAKGYSCQIVLTTKRLIIYSSRYNKRKRVKRKGMNEIDLSTINRLEYGIDYKKKHILIKILGLLIFLAGAALGYLLFMGQIAVPTYVPAYLLPYAKYVAAGLVSFIGLLILFKRRKLLYFKVESLNKVLAEEEFDVNKYNEVAIRYIASKIRPN